MSLALQFNLAGAWKNVLTFDADVPSVDLDLVVDQARGLLDLADREGSLRVVDGTAVVLIADKFGRKDWPFGRKAA